MDDQYDANQERIQQASLPENQRVKIEQVYQMLTSQRFTEWYLTRFEDHIGREEAGPLLTKNEILVDLRGMLS